MPYNMFEYDCLGALVHKGVHITGSKHNPMYGDCMVKRTGAVEFSRCWKRVSVVRGRAKTLPISETLDPVA